MRRRYSCLRNLQCLLWLSLSVQKGSAAANLEGCNRRRVAVLDLDVVFQDVSQGRPPCFPLTLMVTPSDGRVYITNNITRDSALHVAGAHAAGFYTAEAIKQSENYTPHLDQAEVVFVNDYCYWVWWLAWVNFAALTSIKPKVDAKTPGDFLVLAYEKMMQTPRWLEKKGADFVFFDGHPGFYEGDAKHQIWPLRCGAMQNSVQVIMGKPQRRRCQDFAKLKERLVIAPLMAPLINPNNENMYTHDLQSFWNLAKAEHSKQSEFVPLKDRETLLYFKGRCDPHSKNSAGRRMRNYLARTIFQSPEDGIDVTCLEDIVKAAELLESAAVYGEMREAVFCLILPGQQQMSDAVARAFLAGCVPVFVGPPFHTIPLAEVVDYKTAAVFIQLDDTKVFLDEGMIEDDEQSSSTGIHPLEARWWTPDLIKEDMQASTITVPSAEHLLAVLKGIKDKGDAQKRMESVWQQRHKFQYVSFSEKLPGAVQAIMQEVCYRIPEKKQVKWDAS